MRVSENICDLAIAPRALKTDAVLLKIFPVSLAWVANGQDGLSGLATMPVILDSRLSLPISFQPSLLQPGMYSTPLPHLGEGEGRQEKENIKEKIKLYISICQFLSVGKRISSPSY